MNIALKDFYNQCVLVSIINAVMTLENAVMTLENPDYGSLHSWDGENYSTNDWEGTRATVSFYNEGCVAACRDENSKRLATYQEADSYLKGTPKHIYTLAHNEAFQYLLDNVGDKTVPLITTAFWIEGDIMYTIDTQSDMMENGMHILKNQLLEDVDHLIEICVEEYEMSPAQIQFAKHLFNLKVKSEEQPIQIQTKDFAHIFTPLHDYDDGIESLMELGFTIL